MSAPNPQVQVFHFTSRISSAKIRKYKLATERGMSSGSNIARTPTPTSVISKASPSPSVEPTPVNSFVAEDPSMEPPAKKPRLKLSVRPPSRDQGQSPDNITVSRPRRDSSLRIRYSENMSIDESDTDARSKQPSARPSPAASSDLSSVSSAALREPTPVEKSTRPSSKPRDYGRDFMSYYVTGDDDDEDDEVEEVPPPQSAPSKSEPPKPAPAVQKPAVPAAQATKFKHHNVPPTYPSQVPKAPPPPRPHPPQPVVQLVDTIRKASGPRKPETVAEMVKKLETLSTALTNFGGVPPIPKSPTTEGKDGKAASEAEPRPKGKAKAAAEKGEEDDAEVDGFLAMFDDEDSDEKDDKSEKPEASTSNLDYTLQKPGVPDGPLSYGIQFIQNALKSWAQQRLTGQATQKAQEEYMRQARADANPKRGPGRPRKFDDEEPLQPTQQIIQVDVMKTPEGAAIAAFQDVLDGGCLQVNAVLPVELTRALRHLYMQIDHLINQGARHEPQWQCMSYSAQVIAHRIRVDTWKDAHAKAQAETARQQQLAQQQVMQQMGIPPSHGKPLTAEQAQHAHAIELERRRSMQHAAQQPHLTKYLTNPMSLDSPPTTTPTGAAPSPAPANGTSASSPAIPTTSAPSGFQPQPGSADAKGGFQLDKMKLYMPNYLPRSGQSMKFSFAPHSELALKAFGSQAFPSPSNNAGNLPNRGPMMPGPMNPPPLPNGPSPVLKSNSATPAPHASNRSNSQSADVVMINADQQPLPTQGGNGKLALPVASGLALAKNSEGNFGKFVPIEGTTVTPQHSSTISTGSPVATKTPKTPTDVLNGFRQITSQSPAASPGPSKSAAVASPAFINENTTNLLSRFPHPGAVVLDQ